MRQALRAGMADGWGGSMCGTEFSDVMFGTPMPVDTEANLGVMKEDEVNIIVHGHDPSLSEMICEYAGDPEMIALAKSLGAKGINVAGVCCTSNEVAIESWGPQYHGVAKVKHWFEEWNTRGTVLQWDIKQYFHKEDQTIAEWYFKNTMDSGRVEAFDGMSLVKWTAEDTICFLQEFGCNEHRYDPYQDGQVPKFRDEQDMWF